MLRIRPLIQRNFGCKCRWFSEDLGSRVLKPTTKNGTIPQPANESICLVTPASGQDMVKYSNKYLEKGFSKNDIFVHPDFISDSEHSLLVKSCERKLKRLAHNYEMGHFDKRIHNYRECSVSAWLPRQRTPAAKIAQAIGHDLTPDPAEIQDRPAGKSSGWTTVGKSDNEIRFILDRVWNMFPESFAWLSPHILDLHQDGEILAHVDNPEYSGFVVGGLCLLGPAVSTFRHVDDPEVRVDVMLNPKSLYFMTNYIRYQFTHEITLNPEQRVWNGQEVPKARRISLMFRDAKEPDGGWASSADMIKP